MQGHIDEIACTLKVDVGNQDTQRVDAQTCRSIPSFLRGRWECVYPPRVVHKPNNEWIVAQTKTTHRIGSVVLLSANPHGNQTSPQKQGDSPRPEIREPFFVWEDGNQIGGFWSGNSTGLRRRTQTHSLRDTKLHCTRNPRIEEWTFIRSGCVVIWSDCLHSTDWETSIRD